MSAELLGRGRTLVRICNACRYCEGLCAVFPALERLREASPADLHHLANLCHACGACHFACPFAPPHDFDLHVPDTFARIRTESWRAYALLPAPAGAVVLTVAAAFLATSALLVAVLLARGPEVLFIAHTGPGAFYRVLSHEAMVTLFGLAFLWGFGLPLLAALRFWRAVRPSGPVSLAAWGAALRDALILRNLDGGGAGCPDGTDAPRDRRRLFHHLTFYGFLLCFLATSVATLYHYLLGRIAPYPWWDLPVVAGTLGGLGLVVGPLGLVLQRRRRLSELRDSADPAGDDAFSLLLALVAASGLLLLALRATAAMPLLLVVHLGLVLALFLVLPWTRFSHAPFRFAALLREAVERTASRETADPGVPPAARR